MFLRGRVATGDGTALPTDVLVERVCNAAVRQQVYATSRGDFSMQLGSMADSFLDATGERPSQRGVSTKDLQMGISRRELVNCELRASVSGFQSSVISLVDLTDLNNKSVDVGSIVVQRRGKVEGATLSAIPYKAPKDARKAYETGLAAERNGKLINARKDFEKAVQIYPAFANAWFQLGAVLYKDKQKDAARAAFTRASSIDTNFLPPYISLASMACETENWAEVLDLTGHVLDLDPLNHVTGYILDLGPMDYAEAYFYNALANYRLNRIEAAEKSARKAEDLDLRTRFPQLHLVLAEIFARRHNYASAISEIQTYLDLAPHARDADKVRERLAKLEKLNNPASTSENPDQN
jgi:tetratricopeptide (TPR) repeat protein